eukprot:1157568-Pelagomonas_calceolata.AAC.1
MHAAAHALLASDSGTVVASAESAGSVTAAMQQGPSWLRHLLQQPSGCDSAAAEVGLPASAPQSGGNTCQAVPQTPMLRVLQA